MRVIAKQIGNVTRYETATKRFDIIPIKEYWPYGYGKGKPRTTFVRLVYPLPDNRGDWSVVLRDRKEAMLFIEMNG